MGASPQLLFEAAARGAHGMVAGAACRLQAPLGWGAAAVAIGTMLTWLAATNHWMSWARALRHAHANDEPAYLVMARAFPGFPAERIADQHAQRWPVHWAVGGLADLTGTAPEAAYRLVALALALGVCFALAAVLIRVGATTAVGAIALAVFALNTYALRYYGLAPGYLADLVFDLGLALALLGLVGRRLALVLVGLLLGVAARQTMLPVAAVAAGWVALAPAWRDAPGPRWGRAGAVLALPVAAYLVVDAVAGPFSKEGPALGRLTIADTVLDLPGTAAGLVNHFAHWAIGLLAICALLGATLLATGWRGLPATFWGSLAIGGAVIAQAALLNPDPIDNDYWSTNEPRLVAIGLGAFAVAFAIARGVAERTGARPLGSAPGTVAGILGLFALTSLHHVYTAISTGSKQVTLALAVLGALGMLVAVVRNDRVRAPADP
jgi:hypothetical protein